MNHAHNDLLLTILTWFFAISSFVLKVLPLLQFVSVCLAILLSIIGIYKHLKK